jgi:hypothetical protein
VLALPVNPKPGDVFGSFLLVRIGDDPGVVVGVGVML